MVPEFHPGAFDVEVCEVESVFLQITVVPTPTFSSPGEKALFPSDSAPTGIVTDEDGPPGAGGGDGSGDGAAGDESPQAVANAKINETRARRSGNMGSSVYERVKRTFLVPSHDHSVERPHIHVNLQTLWNIPGGENDSECGIRLGCGGFLV